MHLAALQQHFGLSLEIARGGVQAFGLGKVRQGGSVIATVAAKRGTPQIRRGRLCIARDGLRVGGFGASKIRDNLPRPTEIHARMTRTADRARPVAHMPGRHRRRGARRGPRSLPAAAAAPEAAVIDRAPAPTHGSDSGEPCACRRAPPAPRPAAPTPSRSYRPRARPAAAHVRHPGTRRRATHARRRRATAAPRRLAPEVAYLATRSARRRRR